MRSLLPVFEPVGDGGPRPTLLAQAPPPAGRDDRGRAGKDKALADAVAKQPRDPAVQSMAAFADAVKRLAEDVQWTADLGNAFLASS